MRFSVIIPTKNRAQIVEQAILSVFNQTESAKEIIVVNDCSDEYQCKIYKSIESKFPSVKFINLTSPASISFGKSKAVNIGYELSTGDFITFLDDDDYWTDVNYLQKTEKLLQDECPVDVVLSLQSRSCDGVPIDGSAWLDDIASSMGESDASVHGFHRLTKEQLMSSNGFCHMNTLIVRRGLFESIRGIDQCLEMYEDYDFYVRAIDAANDIYLNNRIVANHVVPMQDKKSNISTQYGLIKKRLILIGVANGIANFGRSEEVLMHANTRKANALRDLTRSFVGCGKYGLALRSAVEALANRCTFKWAAYTCYLSVKCLLLKGMRR